MSRGTLIGLGAGAAMVATADVAAAVGAAIAFLIDEDMAGPRIAPPSTCVVCARPGVDVVATGRLCRDCCGAAL